MIVMLHGFGNDKHEWQYVNDYGDNADKWHWNSHWFAKHGYYVVNYTARGFDTDKDPDEGSGKPDTPPGTSTSEPNGTIHLKSREFEVRDTQWLAALTAKAFPDIDEDQVAAHTAAVRAGCRRARRRGRSRATAARPRRPRRRPLRTTHRTPRRIRLPRARRGRRPRSRTDSSRFNCRRLCPNTRGPTSATA